MRPFVFLILTSSGPFLKCHCFNSRLSKYLNALNYFPRSGFGKRNMLFGHIGFRNMKFALPNSVLDAFYLRLNLKDQVKILKLL